MNKRAQSGIVGFFIYLGVFVAMWAFFIADLLTWVGENALASGQVTGVELFILSNLNIVVFVCVIIALGAFSAVGGRQ